MQVFSDRWLNDFAKLSLHADEEGGKNVALANQKYWRKSRKIFVSVCTHVHTHMHTQQHQQQHEAAHRHRVGGAASPHWQHIEMGCH